MSRRQGKQHVLAWLDALYAAKVSTPAKAVGGACATHANYLDGRDMRAGLSVLAAEATVSYSTAQRALRELQNAGLLTWDGKQHAPGLPRRYSCTLPEHRSRVTSEHKSRVTAVRSSTQVTGDPNTGQMGPEHRSPDPTLTSHRRSEPIVWQSAPSMSSSTATTNSGKPPTSTLSSHGYPKWSTNTTPPTETERSSE